LNINNNIPPQRENKSVNHNDCDHGSPATVGLSCGACKLPIMQFDLRTPSQWDSEAFAPDAYERFEAGYRRDRLLHVNSHRHHIAHGKGSNKNGTGKKVGGDDSTVGYLKGSDVVGACSGSEPSTLAASADFLKKVIQSSDDSKLKEEKMRNNEERKLLLGIPQKQTKVQEIKPLDYNEHFNDDDDSLESEERRKKEEKAKIQKMFIKYGATFFPETCEHKLTYLHEEILKHEEEVDPLCVPMMKMRKRERKKNIFTFKFKSNFLLSQSVFPFLLTFFLRFIFFKLFFHRMKLPPRRHWTQICETKIRCHRSHARNI
jgi:hypothetical protein